MEVGWHLPMELGQLKDFTKLQHIAVAKRMLFGSSDGYDDEAAEDDEKALGQWKIKLIDALPRSLRALALIGCDADDLEDLRELCELKDDVTPNLQTVEIRGISVDKVGLDELTQDFEAKSVLLFAPSTRRKRKRSD